MSDLISRKWLMECVDEGWIKFDTEKDTNTYIHLVRDIAPSAQPEIIRCKDCKWYKTNFSWNGKEHKVCVIEPYEPVRNGDDFCSRGERKDDY